MTAPRWTIDPDGHLLRRDGTATLLFADTAWELTHTPGLAEATEYLGLRAAQGFNAALVQVVPEIGGFSLPSADGHFAFEGYDVTRPVEAYWSHVDDVIAAAEALDVTLVIAPFWGRWWSQVPEGQQRPPFTPETVESYGRFLGHRYRDADVIWMLGGDEKLRTDEHRATQDRMAAALREAEAPQLLTFHPNGPSDSADTHADSDWIDLHLSQSGHAGWGNPNYEYIEQDYRLVPPKPTLDSEANYEAFPVHTPDWTPLEYRFGDFDVRRAAYQALLSGACGHVYGCNDTWQFWDPERTTGMRHPIFLATTPWREAIDRPGAVQMGHVVRFCADVDLVTMIPDQSVIAYDWGVGSRRRCAMVSDDRVVVYDPEARDLVLDLSRWQGQPLTVRWFDPVEGQWTTPAPGPHASSRTRLAPGLPGGDGLVEIRR